MTCPGRAMREEFPGGEGYLAVAAMGLPNRGVVRALADDLAAWHAGERTPADYGDALEASRALYARLVGVPVGTVATGSQTSALAAVVAASLPAGAQVLTVEGEFTSITYPFAVRDDVVVRSVPLAELAASVTDATSLVTFSLIQSATGEIADADAVVAAAAEHGARTLCDLTQAAGVHPVDASRFDVTVCHAYKWLGAPRGAAFLTVRPGLWDAIVPVQAGWYAGRDVWEACYGATPDLAPDARRYDVAPTWLAWRGAEPALRLADGLDMAEVWAHAAGLGEQVLDALGEPARRQAIVTVPDPSGAKGRALAEAGVRASGRAGRLRLAFHLWNDVDDVERVARALRGAG